MNKIINKFLLAAGKFMPEMHLRQPRFTYIAFGPFIKNKEKLQTFKETDSKYIYQIELDKACFQHNIAYGGLKIYLRNQLLTKYYMIKHLILLKIQNMLNIKEILRQWFKSFLIKRLCVVLLKMKSCKIRN